MKLHEIFYPFLFDHVIVNCTVG